ncbi:hypothetical protein PT974_11837 [Cladobotryum mycophilum]|uniref:Zinc finger PHD-type domain-containing protein n=1 Tax=Cladobotryum mycophilum TaxID=491253 RepID=A0ABR0S7F6_9HYPO
MPSQKRPSQAVEDELVSPLLRRIRNMWQFANLCQWIYIFGKAARIDESIDIEEIETECLKPNSTILADIALALLKLVSSHRGLTHDIFDDQARKLYSIKSSGFNPFGEADAPQHFTDFDIFTKIKVLQQLTQWAMIRPERIRDNMEEQKDIDQTAWRIEPYGWDNEDRTYYVLDDNRVYRLSQPPPKPSQRPTKSKSYSSGRRSSKRRRNSLARNHHTNNEDGERSDDELESGTYVENEGLGGMAWECVAVTLPEVQSLLGTMARTRDENEKVLRKQLEVHLVPILEKQEEARKRRELQRERELLNLAKMANAKRSSRIANKIEQQKLEDKVKTERQQKEVAEETKRHEEKIRMETEREREYRLVSREKRLKERETRRQRHEEQLMQLSGDHRDMPARVGRVSERNLQAEIDKNKQALKDLEQEEESWIFDCVCGLYGQVDDGAHSVACERCNVWQHSKCLGISKAMADRPDFHFICTSCSCDRDQEKLASRTPEEIKLHCATNSNELDNSIKVISTEANGSPNGARPLPNHINVTAIHQASHIAASQQNTGHVIEYAQEPLAHGLSTELASSPKANDSALSNGSLSLQC